VLWEKLAPGPSGRKIGVVDYDAANKRHYPPVDLDDPLLLANHGLYPSESRFHQQMVLCDRFPNHPDVRDGAGTAGNEFHLDRVRPEVERLQKPDIPPC